MSTCQVQGCSKPVSKAGYTFCFDHDDLIGGILEYINAHNENLKPFI